MKGKGAIPTQVLEEEADLSVRCVVVKWRKWKVEN
jgi:hypothetical protein